MIAVAALIVVASYLVGAVPFGYLVARWHGVDILHQGSGNIGATNVGRVLGRRLGLLVFLLDFAKGALPAGAASLAAAAWAKDPGAGVGPEVLPVAAGLAAFLGHVFPVYLRFRGGKGVATAAGVVAVLFPWPTLGALLTWVAVVSATRYVSLASLSAAAVLCALHLGASPAPFAPGQRTLTVFCLAAAALVAVRHRANVTRLLRGTENQVRDTPAMRLFTKTVHVLALGLWFGSSFFFTFVVAPVVFHTYEVMVDPSAPERAQVPLPEDYDKDKADRLAGAGLRPVFPWFFLLQGVCALLAVSTALAWRRSESRSRVHRARFLVLALALAAVLAGWPLVQKVNQVRAERFDADPAVAAPAQATFAAWHLASLSLELVTIALVGVGLALAAHLPAAESPGYKVPEGEPGRVS